MTETKMAMEHLRTLCTTRRTHAMVLAADGQATIEAERLMLEAARSDQCATEWGSLTAGMRLANGSLVRFVDARRGRPAVAGGRWDVAVILGDGGEAGEELRLRSAIVWEVRRG